METTATTEAPVYERELQIDASPETVWEFLVDPEKVARWKGLPATAFDPQPGGAYRIEIVPGHVASGAFVELERPRRLVYTWGWEPGAGRPEPGAAGLVDGRDRAGAGRTAARGCGSPIATCPASRPRSRMPRAGITTSSRLVDRGAGRRPRARPVARRACLIERRVGA